jgi:hypothetical protein
MNGSLAQNNIQGLRALKMGASSPPSISLVALELYYPAPLAFLRRFA